MPFHLICSLDNAGKEGKNNVSTMKHIQNNYILLNLSSVLDTLNKKLVEVGHMGIKGGPALVNHLVD